MFDLPNSELESISFFQEKGILPKNCICQYGHSLELFFDLNKNAYFWKDNHASCKNVICIRTGNWFSGINSINLSFMKIIRFIYGWSHELTTIKWCKQELGLYPTAVVKLNRYMRKVCIEILRKKGTMKIGGYGKIVEIDCSLINNYGCRQVFFLGGICRETKECFVVEVPDLNALTICNFIKENIENNTMIYSNCWEKYGKTEMEKACFSQFMNDHAYNFVNPDTYLDVANIDKLFYSAKWRNIQAMEIHHVESYLNEFIWRNRLLNKDPFDEILSNIKECRPPQVEF